MAVFTTIINVEVQGKLGNLPMLHIPLDINDD
jgi:hypothetical protein